MTKNILIQNIINNPKDIDKYWFNNAYYESLKVDNEIVKKQKAYFVKFLNKIGFDKWSALGKNKYIYSELINDLAVNLLVTFEYNHIEIVFQIEDFVYDFSMEYAKSNDMQKVFKEHLNQIAFDIMLEYN